MAHKGEAFIALDQAKQLWHSGGAHILVARDAHDCATGPVGYALNLPAPSFEPPFGETAPMLTPESHLARCVGVVFGFPSSAPTPARAAR